jgi:hypothetical protein
VTEAGYRLQVAEQTIQDPAVRDILGISDYFLLYTRD